MFDKLLDFVINSVRAEEKAKQDKLQEQQSLDHKIARPVGQFFATMTAWSLIEPCKKKAAHHREREQAWTKKLEEAEAELREKGISLDVYDSTTGTYLNNNMVASGLITGVANQQFQPRVDQKLMDGVRSCKQKMLDHREKAIFFEKHARAFAINPDFTVKLTIEDCHTYGLEG